MVSLAEQQPRSLAPLLTPEIVGQHLSVSTATVYRLIARGELRALQVGRQYRVEPEALEAYKEHRRAQAAITATREGADG